MLKTKILQGAALVAEWQHWWLSGSTGGQVVRLVAKW